jgi:aminoglycoside phosphotransferase (APT) family kinase protein
MQAEPFTLAGVPEDLVVLRTGPARRRSSVLFLGPAGGNQVCRWVLKRPNSQSRQVDLQAPLPAADQYDALQRLHRHLTQQGGSVRTPRPVALVPEIDAYVMEYVPGPTVAALLTPATLLHPGALLEAVEAAARVLRAVHSLAAPLPATVDLGVLDRRTAAEARDALTRVALPTNERWFSPSVADRRASTTTVLLHGDFCPENVLLSPSGPVCLDPDLCVRDWPEHDVVRFLLMLADAPLFVAGTDVPAVQRLRRRTTTAFLDALYGAQPWPELLRPLMLLAVAARWSTRRTDLARRTPPLRRVREALLRRHFSTLLDEVSSPAWPGVLR